MFGIDRSVDVVLHAMEGNPRENDPKQSEKCLNKTIQTYPNAWKRFEKVLYCTPEHDLTI